MKARELPATSPGQEISLAELGIEHPAAVAKANGANLAGAEEIFWQAGLFALVGVANTLLDFAVYNALTSNLAGLGAQPG